jgi:zinc protease
VAVVRPEPQLAQLGNGFSLWAIERNSPTLSLRVSCRVGSRDNPKGRAGLAALTTRMLTEGTTAKTSLELATAAEALGTALAQNSGRDESSIEMEVLPEHEERAINLLAEVLLTPGFHEEDFLRVRAEWLDDLTVQRENPTRLAWLIGYRALLGPEHGVGSQGTPSEIRSVDSKAMRAFFSEQWRPERCALLAVGPTSTSDLEAIAGEAFGGWAPGKPRSPAAPPVLSPPGRTQTYVFDRPGSVQTSIFIAGSVPRRHEPGHEARGALNNLLGGLFTSRLNLNLREKNAYTYGAFSTLVTTQDWGLWAISTSVRNDVTRAALNEVANELNLVRTPGSVIEEELFRSKTDLIFNTSANLEHTSMLLDELQELFVYELRTDYFSTYAQLVSKLDLEQINAQLVHVPQQAHVVALVGDQRKLVDANLLDEHTRSVGLQWLDSVD